MKRGHSWEKAQQAPHARQSTSGDVASDELASMRPPGLTQIRRTNHYGSAGLALEINTGGIREDAARFFQCRMRPFASTFA